MAIEVALSRSAIASRCRPRIEGSHASPFLASPKNPAQLTVAPQVNFRLRDCCGEAGLTDVNAPLLGTR
jgi:hypothetical protein